ncbi:MAG: hypothetical protein ACK4UP_13850, partial [Spirosomataceae bacterium]
NVDFIKKIGGKDVLIDQNIRNFIIILVNKDAFKATKKGFLDIIGFDTVHKLIEDQVEGSVPMMAITAMDDNRRVRIPFVIVSSHADSDHFVDIFEAIGEYVAENNEYVSSYDDWKEKVTVMIDDGSPETLALLILGINFVLCSFHVIKAIKEWIRRKCNHSKHNIPPEEFGKVLGFVYRMLHATSVANFLEVYAELKEKYPDFVEAYFYDTWIKPQHRDVSEVQHFMYWFLAARRNGSGAWYTNNNNESAFRKYTTKRGVYKKKRIDIGVTFAVELVQDEYFESALSGLRHKNSKSERLIISRFKTAEKLALESYFVDIPNLVVDVPSTTEKDLGYHVHLRTLTCGCADCVRSGKLCARKIAAMLVLAKSLDPPMSINSDVIQFSSDICKKLFPNLTDLVLPELTFATQNPWYKTRGQVEPEERRQADLALIATIKPGPPRKRVHSAYRNNSNPFKQHAVPEDLVILPPTIGLEQQNQQTQQHWDDDELGGAESFFDDNIPPTFSAAG